MISGIEEFAGSHSGDALHPATEGIRVKLLKKIVLQVEQEGVHYKVDRRNVDVPKVDKDGEIIIGGYFQEGQHNVRQQNTGCSVRGFRLCAITPLLDL